MTIRSWILFLGLMTVGNVVFAVQRAGDQGVGIMLGSPSGLTWKMFLDEKIAIDAAAGIARSDLNVHASLLWHNFDWAHRVEDKLVSDIVERGEIPFYVGIGARSLFRDDTEFGIRFPLGLSFMPHQTKWEFFFELAPILRIAPSSGFNGDFAIGARYSFQAIRPRTQK